MNITLNIEAGTPVELHEAITGLAGILGGTVAPEPEKAKRGTRGTAKTEKQPDQEPVNTPAAVAEDVTGNATDTGTEEVGGNTPDAITDDVAEDTPETETEKIPTVVELRAMAQTKGGTPEGKIAIKALLDKFESKSISNVPENKRTAFLAGLNDLGKSDKSEEK